MVADGGHTLLHHLWASILGEGGGGEGKTVTLSKPREMYGNVLFLLIFICNL